MEALLGADDLKWPVGNLGPAYETPDEIADGGGARCWPPPAPRSDRKKAVSSESGGRPAPARLD